MGDRLQSAAGVRIGEHDRAERLPVQAAVGAQQMRPELPDDGRQARRSRRDHLPGDRVRVDHMSTMVGQQLRHRALARADPTGQPHPQHIVESAVSAVSKFRRIVVFNR